MRSSMGVLLSFLLMAFCCTEQDTLDITSPCKPCKIALRSWNTITVNVTIITIGNCAFKVFYKKRTCNYDACQELKLEKIEMWNPNPCDELLEEEIPGAVLGRMIETNAMYFYPDSLQPGGNGCWRFIRPSCWRVQDSVITSCPPNQVTGNGDLVNPATVRYQIGEFAPCDTASCCMNVIYPTLNGCGERVFDVPEDSDYPWIHYLRDVPPDSADSAAFVKSLDEYGTQFTDTTCIVCGTVGTPPPAPCKKSCPEDIMAEYRRIINARLKRLYGG